MLQQHDTCCNWTPCGAHPPGLHQPGTQQAHARSTWQRWGITQQLTSARKWHAYTALLAYMHYPSVAIAAASPVQLSSMLPSMLHTHLHHVLQGGLAAKHGCQQRHRSSNCRLAESSKCCFMQLRLRRCLQHCFQHFWQVLCVCGWGSGNCLSQMQNCRPLLPCLPHCCNCCWWWCCCRCRALRAAPAVCCWCCCWFNVCCSGQLPCPRSHSTN